MSQKSAPARVCDALVAGELSADDLRARPLGEFLGKTTSVLYHHWGSLDGFLYAVSEAGFALLAERVIDTLDSGDPETLAATYVTFGLDAPDLYAVMFERTYDWDKLRQAGAFDEAQPGMTLWERLSQRLAAMGSPSPQEDARLIFAGLHGLVSLAITGRANIGDLSRSDREVAISSGRRLVRNTITQWSSKHE
jgi:AcrR family transcriptional regulator